MKEIVLKAPTGRAIDPATFEPVLYGGSPLLNLRPNSFGLTQEVTEWLDENSPGQWRFVYDGNQYRVIFHDEEVCTMFILRWM